MKHCSEYEMRQNFSENLACLRKADRHRLSQTGCSIVVCNCREVLFSKGIFLREGTPISPTLADKVNICREILITEELPITDSGIFFADTVFPLTSPLLSIETTALILLRNGKMPITGQERICAKLVASLINTLE